MGNGAAKMLAATRFEEQTMLQVPARKFTPYLTNGCPKTCAGCGNPFVIREGRAEAIVGPDDRLYCYGTACDEAAFATAVSALKRAS